MTAWEYRVIDLNEAPHSNKRNIPTAQEENNYLNSFGKDGWELLSITRTNPDGGLLTIRAYLKRQL